MPPPMPFGLGGVSDLLLHVPPSFAFDLAFSLALLADFCLALGAAFGVAVLYANARRPEILQGIRVKLLSAEWDVYKRARSPTCFVSRKPTWNSLAGHPTMSSSPVH